MRVIGLRFAYVADPGSKVRPYRQNPSIESPCCGPPGCLSLLVELQDFSFTDDGGLSSQCTSPLILKKAHPLLAPSSLPTDSLRCRRVNHPGCPRRPDARAGQAAPHQAKRAPEAAPSGRGRGTKEPAAAHSKTGRTKASTDPLEPSCRWLLCYTDPGLPSRRKGLGSWPAVRTSVRLSKPAEGLATRDFPHASPRPSAASASPWLIPSRMASPPPFRR